MLRESAKWVAAGLLAAVLLPIQGSAAKEIVRPEEIKSKRLVIYDNPTYAKLAKQWKEYDDQYPSEYAYANWMYAARYAGEEQYSKLLAKGLQKYPANPTLLYLKSLEWRGARDNAEERKYLERAAALDPGYMDPWFSLVTVYMSAGDTERLDLALRRILGSGIIPDHVIDYNYNMLIGLEANAILVTNGDNDTYPGWILTRILEVRPDVAIVNRSLLYTDWYPLHVIERGVPRFTDQAELEKLRTEILVQTKQQKTTPSPAAPLADTLILQIVESAQRAGRPVYLSKTMNLTEPLKGLAAKGRDLGLVTLVTPNRTPYPEQLENLYGKWIGSFRTGGLDGWRLREAPETDAGRLLLTNYAPGAVSNLDSLRAYAPDLRAGLFRWYIQHVERLLTQTMRSWTAEAWCRQADVAEIEAWCKQQGLGK